MLVLDLNQKFAIEFLIDSENIEKAIKVIELIEFKTPSITKFGSLKRIIISNVTLQASSNLIRRIKIEFPIYSENDLI